MMEDKYNTYLGKSYRFLTYEGLFNTIETQSLRFSRVDQFNDPLDNCPLLAPYDWSEYITEGYGFINFLKSHVFSKVFSSLYICCFCKEFDTDYSYLMWSHYCQSHSQVCFEIDFALYKYLGGPSTVLYTDNLRKFRDELKSKPQDEVGLYIVTTKLIQWKYEKETRLIIDILDPSVDFKNYTSNSDGHFLYAPFNLKYVSKVIFGANSDKFNEIKTIRMFQERGIIPIFQKMIIDAETLKLKAVNYVVNRS